MKPDSSTLLLSIVCAFIYTTCTVEVTSPSLSGPPPYLSVASQQLYFLTKVESWKPGLITQVTLLMAGTPLAMQIELSVGKTELGNPSFYLLYKCSPDDKEFSEVDLQNATSATNRSVDDSTAMCKQLQPFVISGLQDAPNDYNISLLTANGTIRFEDSLRHALELRLAVRYSGGDLQSKSLFIFNWDALPNMDTVKRNMSYSGRSIQYTRYILTEEGIRYLTEITAAGQSEFKVLQFLDKKFVTLVASSSLLVKVNLAVTVLMKFGDKRSCSGDFEPLKDVVISTGEPLLFNDNFKSFSFVHSSLDLTTGALHVTDRSFKLFAHSPASTAVTVCLRISVNSGVWDYHVTKTIMVDKLMAASKGSPLVPKNPKCKVHGDKSGATVSLIAGMQNVVLRSPIVCDVPEKEHLVFFNKTGCVNPKQVNQLLRCPRYDSTQSKAVIMLAGSVTQYHSGTYLFTDQNVRFEYTVSVVSLPLFNRDSGMYQPETKSNLHAALFNLTCRAAHSAIAPRLVSMAPYFRLASKTELQELSADSFAQNVLDRPPRVVVQTRTRDPFGSEMTSYTTYSQMVQLLDTRFIVVCRVNMEGPEVRDLFGIGQYQADTQSIVTYYVYHQMPMRAARVSSALARHWLMLVSCCAAAAAAAAFAASPNYL